MSSERCRVIRRAGKKEGSGCVPERSTHGTGRVCWSVETVLPHPLPVKSAELDVLERYFNDLIDIALNYKRYHGYDK